MSIMEKKPKSLIAESYRSLRSNIAYSSFDGEYQIISVTSAVPAEGKSTTAINLAVSLSQLEKKVLLIDCDMRKPSLHKKLGISNISGLTDLLVGKKNVEDASKKRSKFLTILTAGTIPPNPAEMLDSKVMSDFLEECRNHYDHIILDTPPVLAVTDAQLLAAKADATVLVVKANKTKGKTVINSYKELEKVKANIIGTILNDYDNSGERLYYRHESDKKISKFLRKFKR